MNKSMLLIGLLILAGIFFAGPPPDPFVHQLQIKADCASPPFLFTSLKNQAHSFNKTYDGPFEAAQGHVSSAHSALHSCGNDRACANSAYKSFDNYMQQATNLYFQSGYLGVLYNSYGWSTVISDYLNDLANYRDCVSGGGPA